MDADQEQQYLDEVRESRNNPHAALGAIRQLEDELDSIEPSLQRIYDVFEIFGIDTGEVQTALDKIAVARKRQRDEKRLQTALCASVEEARRTKA